jgi:hypothetical protein
MLANIETRRIAPETPRFWLPMGVIFALIFGGATGSMWSLIAIEAYTLGLDPPALDLLGIARAVVYLPLIGAVGLRQLGVLLEFVTLVFALPMVAGFVISLIVAWRLGLLDANE